MGHADQSGIGESPEHVKEDLLVVWERSGIDTAYVATEPVDNICVDGLNFIVFKLDDLSSPSFCFDGIDDGNGVFAVTIWSLVIPSHRLEHADGSPLFQVCSSNAGSHSTIKIID